MIAPVAIETLGEHLRGVEQALEGGSFQEVLRGPVRDLVSAAIAENFAKSQGPAGETWPPRKIVGDGHPLLILSGRLMDEATGRSGGSVEVTDRELTFTVDLPYAATHQYGRARANIPARPYLGLHPDDEERAAGPIAEHGLRLIEGA